MAKGHSHDQNFKNLILDYPRQALEFFAAAEAGTLDDSVRITPVRQEQLKERLGERFRELDVPLLVEWPNGRREALLFVLEEETDPSRFSIHRLAHYCLDLAELCDTCRVVPVVIFLRSASVARSLTLGTERHVYLGFDYLSCVLADIPWQDWLDSDNLVARLNLPNMHWSKEQKIHVYAQAVRGLLSLEPDWNKRAKYVEFIDIYTALTDNERQSYSEQYPEENDTMTGFAERFRNEGMQQGMQQGIQQGERAVLRRQLLRRFGTLPRTAVDRLDNASTDQLELWAEQLLDAHTLDEVFR